MFGSRCISSNNYNNGHWQRRLDKHYWLAMAAETLICRTLMLFRYWFSDQFFMSLVLGDLTSQFTLPSEPWCDWLLINDQWPHQMTRYHSMLRSFNSSLWMNYKYVDKKTFLWSLLFLSLISVFASLRYMAFLCLLKFIWFFISWDSLNEVSVMESCNISN